MTSNFAGEQIQEMTEDQGADWEIEAHVKDALKQFLSPEFLNRIDETIVFHMLNKDNLEKIVSLQLDQLAERLKARSLQVEFTENARKQILEEGYDPAFGARPLKRAIQQKLENRLASDLVAGKFTDGDKIKIDADSHKFIIEKA